MDGNKNLYYVGNKEIITKNTAQNKKGIQVQEQVVSSHF